MLTIYSEVNAMSGYTKFCVSLFNDSQDEVHHVGTSSKRKSCGSHPQGIMGISDFTGSPQYLIWCSSQDEISVLKDPLTFPFMDPCRYRRSRAVSESCCIVLDRLSDWCQMLLHLIINTRALLQISTLQICNYASSAALIHN